jgi:hypothetical protein
VTGVQTCALPISERVDDVVEPKLELAEKIVAGDAVSLRSAPEVVPELAFEQSIDALHLLLFAKLQSVAEDLGSTPAVLAGGVVAPLDGALVLEATVPFEKKLHPLSPAEPANGIRVTSH